MTGTDTVGVECPDNTVAASGRATLPSKLGRTLTATGERDKSAGKDHTTSPIVRVENVSKVYEPSPLWLRFLLRTSVKAPVQALSNVSFELQAGTICAVVGPNGAGKSTLFRVLTGLTTPSDGTVTVGGLDVTKDHLEVRRMIGFVPAGDQTLYLRLSCTENLMFHGRLQGLSGRALRRRISGVLGDVGLADAANRVGFALSAGMRARLQLARALMNRPRLLILDEPTAAVDPVGSHELLQLIQRVVDAGGVSVLLSSHRLEEIEALEDQVAVLHEGRIVYHGDLRAFRSRYSKPSMQLTFAHPAELADARDRLAKVSDYSVETALVDVALVVSGVPAIPDLLQVLGDTVSDLKGITEIPMPLRDILRDLVERSPSETSRVQKKDCG